MKKSKIFCNEKGFSLVELMVAVGIIGTMSAVAVPKFAKFKAASLQATVKQTLSSIYTLQNLYLTEHDHYGDADALEFDINNIDKYNFVVNTYEEKTSPTPDPDRDGAFFKATAVSADYIASCAQEKEDKWCMNQEKSIGNEFPIAQNQRTALLPCVRPDYQDGGCK